MVRLQRVDMVAGTKAQLDSAVAEWTADAASARGVHGHISTVDTSRIGHDTFDTEGKGARAGQVFEQALHILDRIHAYLFTARPNELPVHERLDEKGGRPHRARAAYTSSSSLKGCGWGSRACLPRPPVKPLLPPPLATPSPARYPWAGPPPAAIGAVLAVFAICLMFPFRRSRAQIAAPKLAATPPPDAVASPSSSVSPASPLLHVEVEIADHTPPEAEPPASWKYSTFLRSAIDVLGVVALVAFVLLP